MGDHRCPFSWLSPSSPSSAGTNSASVKARSVAPSNRGQSLRRGSLGSMEISDPDMLGALSAARNDNTDFGVSLESIRSFASNRSDGSWLNQYNSMENVANGKDAWDDEDQGSQETTSAASEISAPRMVVATGKGG